MSDVIVWLKETYNLDQDDAEYVAGLAAEGDVGVVEAAFMTENASDNECAAIATKVSGLMAGYRRLTKPPKPEPKPLVEMTPSPNVVVDVSNGPGACEGNIIKEKRCKKANIVFDESEDIDLKAPPKYSLSHNMGINQIQLLKSLIASVKVAKGKVVFNQFDPDGGGIPLDDARPGFATLLMRGGICEVVDAVMIKKSGKPYWGKKVIPILPTAQQAIEDYKIRKPYRWALINE